MRTLVLLIASPHFSAELWYDQLWPLFFSVVNGAKSASQKCAFLRGLTPCRQKVFHRAPVRADSCSSVGSRRASPCPAGRPEGHNGFILPGRGLRIDVAPAIPFLRFLLRQLEGALRRGKGDNRLMLPAVPLLCSSASARRCEKSAPCRTGAPKPAETATALYPAATAYGLRPTPGQQPRAAAVTAAASRSFSGVNGNLPTL